MDRPGHLFEAGFNRPPSILATKFLWPGMAKTFMFRALQAESHVDGLMTNSVQLIEPNVVWSIP